MTESPATPAATLQAVAALARKADVFASCEVQGHRLACAARGSAAPAEYRLDESEGAWWVSLVTADRWLSESIETDLLHTGDKLDELIDEELAELGYAGPGCTFQHYRSDDKLFTFRTAVPVSPGACEVGGTRAADVCAFFLLAYEACFRGLGDMQGDGDE